MEVCGRVSGEGGGEGEEVEGGEEKAVISFVGNSRACNGFMFGLDWIGLDWIARRQAKSIVK